jgi:oligopeptide transport system ATP-binding protein
VPPLLKVEGLTKDFPLKAGAWQAGGGVLRAVHEASFSLERGETLALVGESGCGKSTTGRLVLRLIEPTAGTVELDGTDLTALKGKALKPYRKRMQIVFQDPLGALNPRRTAGQSIVEPLAVHGVQADEQHQRLTELLKEVELPPEAAQRYPHQFSGGQRQRIVLARALALRPELIVADEPVSALDASIQAQMLMLFKRLQGQHGLAYLFISHDLSVVRFLADRVAIMYLGEILELGPVEAVYRSPGHPYTKALLAAIPKPDPQAGEVQPLAGSVPALGPLRQGCPFASRCPQVMDKCRDHEPPAAMIGGGHYSRCWLNTDGDSPSEQ